MMFNIEVIYADKNIKNFVANHRFNRAGKFLTSPWRCFIIVIELIFALKIYANENISVQTSFSQFDLDKQQLRNVIRKQFC